MAIRSLVVFAVAFVALTVIFPSGARSADCSITTLRVNVTSAEEVLNLVDELNCTGAGNFDVYWSGSIVISQSFNLPNGGSLSITGASRISALEDGSSVDEAFVDVIDANDVTGMFVLTGGSTLSCNNLVLTRGRRDLANGGAINADSVNVTMENIIGLSDCKFLDNHAFGRGGEKHAFISGTVLPPTDLVNSRPLTMLTPYVKIYNSQTSSGYSGLDKELVQVKSCTCPPLQLEEPIVGVALLMISAQFWGVCWTVNT